jgi:hypothetical protein
VAISIKVDLTRAFAKLDALAQRQIPFAAAGTLTDVAKAIAAAERGQMAKSFDRPTPFTLNAWGVIPARKSSLRAVVFAKDIQAAYLEPYVHGGAQVLGSKAAMLTPRDVATNQYGNLPRSKLASLQGRPDVYIGTLTTKSGATIGGVWQRVGVTRAGKLRRGKARNRGAIYSPTQGRLQLLVQFTRPATVTHRFPFAAVALAAACREVGPAWRRNLARALATAR